MTDAIDTKTKLLDVAERLFAERGISATSLRNIIAEAGANIAAIHYHFGSKENLVREVFARRLRPLNQERLARLDKLEADQNKQPSLESIIEAFIEPVIRMKMGEPEKHEMILRLFGQVMTGSETLRCLVAKQLEEIVGRFLKALGDALPQLSRQELVWRFRFMTGALHTIMLHPPIPKAMSDFMDDTVNVKTILMKVIPFLVAGFNAPATELTKTVR
ncbi:TetR family transcriptional regulator [bacterium]|nr:TetR family transcriptional regulator [bacterium]